MAFNVNPKKLSQWAKGEPSDGDDKPHGKHGGDDKADELGKHKSAADVLQGVVNRIENGDEDESVHEALEDFDPDSDDMPRMVEDESMWKEAVDAVEPDGEGEDKYDDPWLVVGMVYLAMGGTFGDDDGDESDDKGGDADESDEDAADEMDGADMSE